MTHPVDAHDDDDFDHLLHYLQRQDRLRLLRHTHTRLVGHVYQVKNQPDTTIQLAGEDYGWSLSMYKDTPPGSAVPQACREKLRKPTAKEGYEALARWLLGPVVTPLDEHGNPVQLPRLVLRQYGPPNKLRIEARMEGEALVHGYRTPDMDIRLDVPHQLGPHDVVQLNDLRVTSTPSKDPLVVNTTAR